MFFSAHPGEISGAGALPQAGVALMFPHTAGPFSATNNYTLSEELGHGRP
jgi:hypothetical protein